MPKTPEKTEQKLSLTGRLLARLGISPYARLKHANGKACLEGLDRSLSVVSNSPLEIQLEVTSFCNLHCQMCQSATYVAKAAHMSGEILEKVYPAFPAALRVIPFGGGEPLLFPHFMELVEKASLSRVDVCFTTNGTMLNPQTAARLLGLGIARVGFSIDGGTQQTYETIRVGAKFSQVTANLKNLAEMKRRKKLPVPVMGMAVVVMASNVRELPELISLAKSAGVEFINFETLITPSLLSDQKYRDYYQRESLANVPQSELAPVVEDCRSLLDGTGIQIFPGDYFSRLLAPAADPGEAGPSLDPQPANVSGPGSSLAPQPPRAGKTPCTLPWSTVYISADGYVRPCCLSVRPMGSLREQTLDEIWNGEVYRDYREQLIQGQYPPECENCVQNGRSTPTPPVLTPEHLWFLRQGPAASLLRFARRVYHKIRD